MRPFTPFEKTNMEYLVDHNVKFTQVQITATGLKKSILDATTPMRTYFKENNVHDYELQAQGPENKVTKKTFILTGGKAIETTTSLYRPVTKEGDPRLWIYGLKDTTDADDIHAIIAQNPNELYVINLTKINIPRFCETDIENPIRDLVKGLSDYADIVSEELLYRLLEFKGLWLDTDLRADTAIGRQVEALLGIPMNASREPDYKGIELKSFRSQRPSIRKNLFCKVPDWGISFLKSGAEIVEKYGYMSGGVKSYRNTLRCATPNTQNLRLNMNYPDNLLEIEEDRKIDVGTFKKVADVAVWRLQTLHQCLLTKHHETFWIEVDSRKGDAGQEQFRFNKIEHTRNPNVNQFDILLEQSMITVDLLLGRPKVDVATGNPKKGGDAVSFKIKKSAAGLLFPQSRFYGFLGNQEFSFVQNENLKIF